MTKGSGGRMGVARKGYTDCTAAGCIDERLEHARVGLVNVKLACKRERQ